MKRDEIPILSDAQSAVVYYGGGGACSSGTTSLPAFLPRIPFARLAAACIPIVQQHSMGASATSVGST